MTSAGYGVGELLIRSVTLEDGPEALRAIDAILRLAQRDLVPPNGYLELAMERAAEAEVDSERLFLRAERNQQILGVLDARLGWPTPHHLAIGQIAVHPKARRQGIAVQMLTRGTRVAKERGLPLEALWAQVLPGRSAAEQFWLGIGSQKVDTWTFQVRAVDVTSDRSPVGFGSCGDSG